MSVLVDTSAWIEFFRKTGSTTNSALSELFTARRPFLTCGPIVMELRAGARDNTMERDLDSALSAGRTLEFRPHYFDMAATVYRQCRQSGVTVRSMLDCLISVMAMTNDVELLHHDRDFNAIASLLPLRVHPASLN